jgi:hypothetical protein
LEEDMDWNHWSPDAGAPDAGNGPPDSGAPAREPCSFAAQSNATTTQACASSVAASIAPKPVAKPPVHPHRSAPKAPPAVKATAPLATPLPTQHAKNPVDGRRWTPETVDLPAPQPSSAARPQPVEPDLEDLLDRAAQAAAGQRPPK